MLTVEKIHGEGGDEQLSYVLRNPNSLLYSNPRFVRLVAEHLDAQAGWLVARRDNALVGLLPFLVKEGPLGSAYNSLAYYGSNGAVIQEKPDTEAKAALVEAFYAEAGAAKACSATIITNPLEQDAAFYDVRTGYNFRDERIGQITHFPVGGEEEALMAQFDDPRPRNIRRAIKEGVEVVKEHDDSAVEFLYRTHVDNIQAIGGLSKSWRFFEAMKRDMLLDDWAIFTATLGGKPIAALLVFYFNKTVEYFTPVIVEDYRNTQALALVIYKAMQDAMILGYVNWSWGGTWLSQGGVYDFKKRWGTSEYRYFYYTRMYNSELAACKPEFLLKHYPGFFLIPYNQLIQQKEDAHV